MSNECHETLTAVLTEVRERYGHLALTRGVDPTRLRPRPADEPLPPWWGDRIPSGHRLIEIAGPGSCGKLSLALAWLKAHDAGGLIVVVDTEREFYPPSAVRAGLSLERLVVVHPRGPREAIEAVTILAGSGGFDAILWPLVFHARPRNAIASQHLRQLARQSGTRVVALLTRWHQADWWALPAADVRIVVSQHEWRWFDGEMTGVDVIVRTERMRGIAVPDWSLSLDSRHYLDEYEFTLGTLRIVSSGARERAGSRVHGDDEVAQTAT